ncbi:hypothetical protein ES692_03505 [Psychroserpens burtonensis]|uniref:Uncharacterized protein n=1 Tax=Psychroserpens burtonensis TaxID=49278 RepID=A0A5C7BJF2_9FLAO|nr:hypothetical protein [Psychroserpens burtonensis]TXE19358.1 hypothetical protein ES692_03505 [Psychroserpens burtonensis]
MIQKYTYYFKLSRISLAIPVTQTSNSLADLELRVISFVSAGSNTVSTILKAYAFINNITYFIKFTLTSEIC